MKIKYALKKIKKMLPEVEILTGGYNPIACKLNVRGPGFHILCSSVGLLGSLLTKKELGLIGSFFGSSRDLEEVQAALEEHYPIESALTVESVLAYLQQCVDAGDGDMDAHVGILLDEFAADFCVTGIKLLKDALPDEDNPNQICVEGTYDLTDKKETK